MLTQIELNYGNLRESLSVNVLRQMESTRKQNSNNNNNVKLS